jgi:hypothetical protein
VGLGGSLRGGSGAGPDDGFIEATGDIASIFIGGSIVGQPGLVKLSGIIRAGGHLGSVEVMKDVIGGGTQTGVIEGDTGIDLVHIHGDLKGGHFDNSGYVSGNGHGIKKIIIDGQIIPGDGANSGQVRA